MPFVFCIFFFLVFFFFVFLLTLKRSVRPPEDPLRFSSPRPRFSGDWNRLITS